MTMELLPPKSPKMNTEMIIDENAKLGSAS